MAKSSDDALQQALAQFNDGVKLHAAEEKAQRAIDKADRAKQQAATALKKLQSDPNASGEDKAAAEAAYRESVDEWTRRKSGEPEPEAAEAESSGDAEAVEGDETETGASSEPDSAADTDAGAVEPEAAADPE